MTHTQEQFTETIVAAVEDRDDSAHFDDGRERFLEARELKERGVIMVLHPYTREHTDLVDFDKEIAQRQQAGLSGHDFWSTPLPQRNWLNRLVKTVIAQHNWIP